MKVPMLQMSKQPALVTWTNPQPDAFTSNTPVSVTRHHSGYTASKWQGQVLREAESGRMGEGQPKVSFSTSSPITQQNHGSSLVREIQWICTEAPTDGG